MREGDGEAYDRGNWEDFSSSSSSSDTLYDHHDMITGAGRADGRTDGNLEWAHGRSVRSVGLAVTKQRKKNIGLRIFRLGFSLGLIVIRNDRTTNISMVLKCSTKVKSSLGPATVIEANGVEIRDMHFYLTMY